MGVAYDRGRFYSFVSQASEGNLLPVIAEVLALGLSDTDLANVKVLTSDEANELQASSLGDVNVRAYMGIVESLKEEIPAGDRNREKLEARRAELLTDVLTLVSVASRRFVKSTGWPHAECAALLGKCGKPAVTPEAKSDEKKDVQRDDKSDDKPAVSKPQAKPSKSTKRSATRPAPAPEVPASEPLSPEVAAPVAEAVAEVSPPASIDQASANQ